MKMLPEYFCGTLYHYIRVFKKQNKKINTINTKKWLKWGYS